MPAKLRVRVKAPTRRQCTHCADTGQEALPDGRVDACATCAAAAEIEYQMSASGAFTRADASAATSPALMVATAVGGRAFNGDL